MQIENSNHASLKDKMWRAGETALAACSGFAAHSVGLGLMSMAAAALSGVIAPGANLLSTGLGLPYLLGMAFPMAGAVFALNAAGHGAAQGWQEAKEGAAPDPNATFAAQAKPLAKSLAVNAGLGAASLGLMAAAAMVAPAISGASVGALAVGGALWVAGFATSVATAAHGMASPAHRANTLLHGVFDPDGAMWSDAPPPVTKAKLKKWKDSRDGAGSSPSNQTRPAF